ncbi:hydroxypyruvate isomerase family protein [Rubellimicrobium roseum]|uniref:TIM barrel protein n=1 Tax=Rubellimicrobium roseum TaxID=687525 RepID=A0A5C4N5W7_9RHOB|nr:TIM barrel protein [Rubellimicrobium roseum]TNC63096.1 TIM barrel protein [Rubellimicrobium roseum]
MTHWRFSANLGFLWKELPLPERIRRAGAADFDALEFHDEAQTADPGALRAALHETGLPVLGLNARMGATAGLAALPGAEAQARADIEEAARTAERVGAKAIHVLSGRSHGSAARDCYVANLRHALQTFGGTVLIEPICQAANPGYFMNSLDLAVAVQDEVADPRLRILFDCFHIEMGQGDTAARFQAVAGRVGHVQIASVPDRAEPSPSQLDYAQLLPAFRAVGYTGALGCEYVPRTTVEAGLGWRAALGGI